MHKSIGLNVNFEVMVEKKLQKVLDSSKSGLEVSFLRIRDGFKAGLLLGEICGDNFFHSFLDDTDSDSINLEK